MLNGQRIARHLLLVSAGVSGALTAVLDTGPIAVERVHGETAADQRDVPWRTVSIEQKVLVLVVW